MIRLHRLLFAWIVVAMLQPVNSAFAAGDDRERVLAGARKEGRLVLYAGMDTEEAALLTNEFSKKYPFIKPEIFRSAGEKIQARFLVEHRANTHSADVFQASIIQVYQLKNLKLLARYVSDEAAAYRDGFKDPQGHWTALYQIPYVIGYNTRLVPAKDVPASYDDLLNPRWKGWIALETEEYQWFYHWMQILGRDKGLDFMKKFAGQNLQMRAGHTLLAQLVAAGEVALATVVYSNRVERMKATGAPIDWVKFKGPTIYGDQCHRNSGKGAASQCGQAFRRFHAVERRTKFAARLAPNSGATGRFARSANSNARIAALPGAAGRDDRKLQRHRGALQRDF